MGKQLSKCISAKTPNKHRSSGTNDIESEQENCENQLLHLIYCNLAARSVTNGVGLDTFVEFYHLNGLWTQEIFAVFYKNTNGNIDEQEFKTVIRQLTKGKDDTKKQVLFNFYDVGHKGFIEYPQLLRMFYSYPKKELTQLLKSSDFQKSLTVADQLELLEKNKTSNQSTVYDLIKNLSKEVEEDVDTDGYSPCKGNQQCESKDEYLDVKNGHTASLKPTLSLHSTTTATTNHEGVHYFTCKINMLIKRYTQYLFRQLGLNYKKDSLTKEMFFQLIDKHPQIYRTYREGFHTYLWECVNGTPELLTMKCTVEGICSVLQKDQHVKRYVKLVRDALVVFDIKHRDIPIEIIFIPGLIVSRYSNPAKNQLGFTIKYRDTHYLEQFFFVSSTEELDLWMQHFNLFLSETIQSKYNLLETIGAGAHSTVSKCYNKKEGKYYAVKIIDQKKVTEVELELIRLEVNILLNLPHPNIAKLKETFLTRNEHYIVSELFEDKDLFEYLNEKDHCTEDQALLVTRKMLNVLKFLKDNGLIHRDLKPENIMVIKDSNKKTIVDVKLIDFGFAVYQCSLKTKSGDHLCVGTINYVAPEILSMDETFDYKVDMFSLGVVVFNMLSGELPFDNHRKQMVVRNTLKCNYSMKKQVWKQVSEKAKEFVRKILVADPEKRISVEQALEDPWITGVERQVPGYMICKHKSCQVRPENNPLQAK